MRARRVLVATLLLLAGLLAARGALWYQSADFFCLYQGSRALLLGHDPYDTVWWSSATGGIYPDPFRGEASSSCLDSYAYPLWTAVALVPIGALPLEAAATVWIALSIGAATLGLATAWRAFGGTRRYAPVYATAVVMSQPFWVLLIGGQLTGVVLGLAGVAALSLARARETLGGVSLALLALKPQLVGLALPVTLLDAARARRFRLVAVALACGAAMLFVPLLVVPAWPLKWLGELGERRLRLASSLPTAWGFGADVFGDAATGAVVVLALLVATAVIVRRPVDAAVVFAVALPLSLVISPHVWSYDFLVLAIPWAFVLSRADSAPPVLRAVLLVATLALAVPLPWILYAVGFARGAETLSVVIPAATALLAAAAQRATPPAR